MVANDLADTRVELEAGSAIVDSGEPNSGTSVTLIYKNWTVHFLQRGFYRIDSDPPRLWVSQGEAEVSAGASGQPVSVEPGMTLPFAGVLVPQRSSDRYSDALSDWSNGRSQSISADNAITAQIDEDPASVTPGLDTFAYFPVLGVPSSSSLYSSFTPTQPGFNSIYLPGYTYLPLMLGFMGRGFRSYLPLLPRRIGVSPGTGLMVPVPHGPILRPAPVHVTPHIGIRVGAHR